MSPAALQLVYLPIEQLTAKPPSWWRTVLGVVGFEAVPGIHEAVPTAATGTPVLDGRSGLCEVWRLDYGARGAFSTAGGQYGPIHHRHGGDFLFGSMTLAEAAVGGAAATALQRVTRDAYQEIFALLEATPYRHLLRTWNYIADINRDADGEERYRRFNASRQGAFRAFGHSVVGSVPAACALGSPAGNPLVIYFLASRRPPCTIENPRQTSAYHYPPQFGAHSPTFSRACLLREESSTSLFISGTASIVGHETMHREDVAAQTLETLANLEAVLAEGNRRSGGLPYTLDNLRLKVYVRHATDFPVVEKALASRVDAANRALYLHADVCRADLLVEIEATGTGAC